MSEAARFLGRIVAALDGADIPQHARGLLRQRHPRDAEVDADLDIVIDPTFDSLDRFLGAMASDDVYLDADVARQELRRRGQFNVIDMSSLCKADLIFRKARPFSRSEMDRRVPAKVLGVNVFVATAEDTVLAKLEWAKLGESERQLRDVAGILEVKGASLDVAYVERWLADLEVRELWDRIRGTPRGS